DNEALPEGERPDHPPRGLTHRRMSEVHAHVDPGEQAPEATLLNPALPDETTCVEAQALEPAVEIEAGRGRSDEEQRGVRVPLADGGERAQELGDALTRVDDPEAPNDTAAGDALRPDVGNWPGRVRHDRDRSRGSGRSYEIVDGVRVGDDRGRVVEDEPGEREVLRSGLPERRDPLVEHAVREEASDDTVLALHRVEVAAAVPAPDRHPPPE